MKQRSKKQKQSIRASLKQLVGQPGTGFYRQPMLHINCHGQIEVENCKQILFYNEQMLRLDMGRWEISLYGDELELRTVSKNLLVLLGRVFKTEFTYKE